MNLYLAELATVFLGFSAYGQDCVPKDVLGEVLRKKPSLKKYLEENNDQLDLGFCYGFALSNAIAIKFELPVSRLSVSTKVLGSRHFAEPLSGRYGPDSLIDIGATVHDAFQALNGKRVCLEKDLPSTPHTVSPSDLKGFRDSYLTLRNLQNKISLMERYASSSLPPTSLKTDILNGVSTAYCRDQKLNRLFAGLSGDQFAEILWRARDRSFPDLIEELESAQCNEKMVTIPNVQLKSYYRSDQPISEIAHKLIDSGRIPVAVMGGRGNAHGVILTGRKSIGGRCFFTFKNQKGELGCGSGFGEGNVKGNPDILKCNNDGTFDLDAQAAETLMPELHDLE